MKQTVIRSESSIAYPGWRVVVGAVVGLAFSPGPVSLLLVGALAPVLKARYGWSVGEVMFNLTVLNLASIPAAPLAGRIVDRVGARTLLFGSLLVMAACLLLWGHVVDSLGGFYLVSAVYGFATVGAQSITYNKLLTGWFDVHRGLVLGIASAGLGLGYSVLPVLIGFGFSQFGPGGATTMLAAILILLPLALNFVVARPNPAADAGRRLADAEGMTLREAIGTPTFWIIAAAIWLVSNIATGLVPQFAAVGRDIGYGPGAIAAIASTFGIATMIGRLFVGWLFDRYFAPRVTCLVFLLAALGYAGSAFAISHRLDWPALAAGSALMGLGFGAESDLIGYLGSRYFGQRYFGVIYGSLLAIFILGVASGPLSYGVVRDWSGSYAPMFAVCAACSAVAGLLLLLLPSFPAASREAAIPSQDLSTPEAA